MNFAGMLNKEQNIICARYKSQAAKINFEVIFYFFVVASCTG
jgi:hypothetical protein